VATQWRWLIIVVCGTALAETATKNREGKGEPCIVTALVEGIEEESFIAQVLLRAAVPQVHVAIPVLKRDSRECPICFLPRGQYEVAN
jgi:hypothetical protein